MLYKSTFCYCLVKRFIWLIFTVVLSAQIMVQPVFAKPVLRIAVGWHKPPYVIQNTQSGFELDLVRDIMLDIGYQVAFVHIPFGRTHEIHETTDIDVVMTMSDRVETPNIYLSKPYVTYQNVAVSLKSKDLKINKVEDLSEYSLVAFQNAHNLLGQQFHKMANSHQSYLEIPDQIRQLRLLYFKKTDVIVTDVNIFNHFKHQMENNNVYRETEIHTLFSPNPYRVGFNSEALRDEFDSALEFYLSSNRYQQLKDQYNFR